MTLVSIPSVGIVYKTRKGYTYTVWYHHQVIGSHTPVAPVDIWVKSQIYYNEFYNKAHPNNPDKIMAVVRQK